MFILSRGERLAALRSTEGGEAHPAELDACAEDPVPASVADIFGLDRKLD